MRFISRICAIGIVAGALSLSLAGLNPVSAADLKVVKFGSVGGITDAPIYLADDAGLFAKAGLKVERVSMTSAPNLMTATATGQLDVAGISITPGLFSSVQQGMQLRIVGDKQSLRPGVSATRLVIRADLDQGSEAKDMQALRGKKIAVSAKASSVYMLLQDLLKKYGMTLDDVHIVELSYPNMLPALTSKAIDAAVDLEPFLSRAMNAGAVKVVSDLSEFVPDAGGTIVPLVYSEKFANEKPEAMAFMKAYLEGVRLYNDAIVKGQNKDKAIEVIAKYANVKSEIVRESFPAGLDPNQRVSRAFLDRLQTFFVEQHYLRSTIDVAKVVDLSFADAAVEKLGPYK